MSVATTPALMTAEEFFDWANQPERVGERYELDNGKVVEMPSPTELHGVICWLVSAILTRYIHARDAGYLTTNDTGLIVKRKPDSVRGPDIMLFLEAKTVNQLAKKHVERIPDLIVEVRSPSDRDSRLLKRIDQYVKRGVRLIWVVDPEDRVVTTYKPKEFPKVHDEADTLSGNGVLPEFSCTVSEFFRMPGETSTVKAGN